MTASDRMRLGEGIFSSLENAGKALQAQGFVWMSLPAVLSTIASGRRWKCSDEGWWGMDSPPEAGPLMAENPEGVSQQISCRKQVR